MEVRVILVKSIAGITFQLRDIVSICAPDKDAKANVFQIVYPNTRNAAPHKFVDADGNQSKPYWLAHYP